MAGAVAGAGAEAEAEAETGVGVGLGEALPAVVEVLGWCGLVALMDFAATLWQPKAWRAWAHAVSEARKFELLLGRE